MAFVVELAKPATVTGDFLPALTGGLAGDDLLGRAQGAFRMKANRFRISSRTRVTEVTGDGDANSAIESNLIPVTVVTISGWMLADQAIGVENLANTDNDGTWAIKIKVSSARSFSGFAVMEMIEADFAANSEACAVVCRLFFSNTAADEIESTLTTQA